MQEVLRENLKIGELYYIESLTEDLNGNIVVNHHVSKLQGIFTGFTENVSLNNYSCSDALFSEFRGVNESIFEGYDVHLNYWWKFYEFKKFKIQQDMEMRACNKILQNIIGDTYFKYYEVAYGLQMEPLATTSGIES
jgi:hypothetical protein